jgi:nucleotide-binding universal stress UspA family protein
VGCNRRLLNYRQKIYLYEKLKDVLGICVYNKILLPTDGSENAEKAVVHGLELAARIGANVVGLYIIDTTSFVSLPEDYMWENVRELLEAEGKKALDFVKKTSKRHKIKIETMIKEGSPSKEIVNTASKEKVDLIIMGTAGRTGLDKFFLGSISEKVLRTASTAVMIIK